MLDRLHLRGIDEVGLSPEQWDAVHEFVTHNFGNLFCGACLTLACCREGLLGADEIARVDADLKRNYREIVETLRVLKESAAHPGVETFGKGG